MSIAKLPWDNLSDITFFNGEEISYSTLNAKLLRLLSNDLTIYNTVNNILQLTVYNYDDLDKDGIIINDDTLVWVNSNDNELSNFVNIVYPIIPTGITNTAYPVPKQCNKAGYDGLDTYINGQLSSITISNYNTILQQIYEYITDSENLENLGVINNTSINANIVRYDVAYYASFNKTYFYQKLYDCGYRWAECIISKDYLNYISKFTDNLKIPYLDASTNTNQTNKFDTVIMTEANQHIISNAKNDMLDSFSSGNWKRNYGSGWLEQGGIAQVQLNIAQLENSSLSAYTNLEYTIKFPESFSNCLNINVTMYNNKSTESMLNETNSISVCSVYVLSKDNEKFTVAIKPSYYNGTLSSSSKQMSEFNIVWKATGISVK